MFRKSIHSWSSTNNHKVSDVQTHWYCIFSLIFWQIFFMTHQIWIYVEIVAHGGIFHDILSSNLLDVEASISKRFENAELRTCILMKSEHRFRIFPFLEVNFDKNLAEISPGRTLAECLSEKEWYSEIPFWKPRENYMLHRQRFYNRDFFINILQWYCKQLVLIMRTRKFSKTFRIFCFPSKRIMKNT